MLGRYVGATLVILGVAMLMAPEDAPERDTPPEARAEAPRPAAPRPAPPAAENLTTVSLASGREADAPAAARSGGEPSVRALTPDATPAPALAADIASQQDGAAQPDRATQQAGAATALSLAPSAEDAEIAVPTLEDPASLEEASLTSPTLSLIAAAERPTNTDAAGETEAAAPEPDPLVLYVTGSRVNVRAGPSTGFSVISSVGFGEAVEVVADAGDGWAEIRLTDGDTGYMARRFLEE